MFICLYVKFICLITSNLFDPRQVANDNDFLQDYGGVMNSNPNQYYVFGFTDDDLDGSKYVPQVSSVARP